MKSHRLNNSPCRFILRMVQQFPKRVVLLAVFLTGNSRIDARVRQFWLVDLVGQVRLVRVEVHHLGRPAWDVRALLVPGRYRLQGVVVVAAQIVLVAVAHVVGLLVLMVHVFQLAAVGSWEGAASVAGLLAAVLPVVPEDPAGDHQYHHQGDQQDEERDVVFPLWEMKDKGIKTNVVQIYVEMKF